MATGKTLDGKPHAEIPHLRVPHVHAGLFVAAAFAASALFADGVIWSDTPTTCHWIGAVKRGDTSQSDYNSGSFPEPSIPYALWTNHNNWAEGIVPGRFMVEDGNGNITTNGSLGCTAVFDGNCDIRCISLYGMVSVSNIVVTGADAPRFIFGHWQWDNPVLRMEAGGEFRVEAGVPVAPYVNVQIVPCGATANCKLLTFENNSAQPFSFGYIGAIDPPVPSGGWFGDMEVVYKGTREIQKRNRIYNDKWSPVMRMEMEDGLFTVMSQTNATYGVALADNYGYIRDVDNGHVQRISIPEGKFVQMTDIIPVRTEAGMSITGTGTIYLSNGANVNLSAANGKTLEIEATIMRPVNAAASVAGINVGASGYAGTVLLSGQNSFTGMVSVSSGATLEVPSFGTVEAGGPVGKLGVSMGGLSFLRYTGSGETTDVAISGAGYGTIILAGDGDLVLEGPFSGGTTYSYTVKNESPTARLVFANKDITKFVNLVDGSHIAFAKPDDSSAIAVGRLEVAGAASVDVLDGVTVTIAQLGRTSSGKMNVTLSGSGGLVVTDATEGAAPDWITVNGKPAWYSADGHAYSLDMLQNGVTIPARGGVVPDAATTVVGITTDGNPSDPVDLLAENDTHVLALNQETAADATVDVAAGQTLHANMIRIKSGAGDLMVGTAQGTGSVTADTRSFDVQVDDAGSTLTVNSTVAVPSSIPINVNGAGRTVFSAFNGYEGLLTLDGATAVLTNVAGATAAELCGSGTLDFKGGVMRLAASGTNAVDAIIDAADPVKIAVTGGVMRLTGAGALPVEEIRVPYGELVIDGVNIHTPGVSVGMSDTERPTPTMIIASNGTAVVRFESGSITGCLELASYVSDVARGAFYQSGGEFANVNKYAENFVIGAKGYAYYLLSGGRHVAAADWYLGGYGEGVLDITGGELWHTPASVHRSRCRIGGMNGYAALRVANGGIFNATNASDALIAPGYNCSESSAEITIEDDGQILQSANKSVVLGMGTSSTYSHSVLNLNGGLLSTYSVIRDRSYVYPSAEWPEGTASASCANTYAFVNCNGGTLRNLGWGALFGARDSSSYPPNRVTLYERGLSIDSNGMTCRIDPGGELKAPSGQGVASVPWNAETDGKGYVGSPVVRIVGDGKGATAWADFDAASGTVTNIHITSPGNDYTYANALITMNRKTLKTIPCTLGTFASGGLTKIGSGTLNIVGTNTYTGATTVRKGTLQLGADDVISSASALVLDGGTLDLNGKSQTFASLSVTTNGGSVVNGTLSLAGLVIDFDDVLAGRPLVYGAAVNFAAGATLEVLNVDKAVRPPVRYTLTEFTGGMGGASLAVSQSTLDALPERWQIQVEGGKIVLRYPVGISIVVR